MEIVYTDAAKADLKYWKESGNLKVQAKILQLLQSIIQTPFKGIGKPEPLKHQLSGTWSRRINLEHRLVYRVENSVIIILALRYHY